MKNNFINRTICLLIGHKKVIPMLIENFHCIHTRACPRCKTPTIGGTVWKNCPPPPNSTEEEIKEFKSNLKEYYKTVRKTLNK